LNTLSDQYYAVEFTQIRSIPERERMGFDARPGSFQMTEPRSLTDDQTLSLRDRYARIRNSKVAKAASQYLYRGRTLLWTGAAIPEVQGAALLDFYKAIEGIAESVTSRDRKEARTQIEERQHEYATQTKSKMQVLNKPKDLVETIREAGLELRRIELQQLNLSIRNAGRRLNLPEETIERAIEFSNFRNGPLAHFRTEIPVSTMRQWTDGENAFRIANAYFVAFLDDFNRS
jgi:hypothetical protein